MTNIKKLFPFFFSFVFFLFFFQQSSVAQLDHFHVPDDERKLDKIANSLFKEKNYKPALAMYLKLDSIAEDPDPEYKYRIAVSYLNTHVNKRKAVDYLEAIEEHKEDFGEDYYYHLGQSYHLDYKFDEAIDAYNKFIEKAKGGWGNDERIAEVESSIERAKNAKKLIQDTVDVRIENIGSTVNGPYMEYAPVISTDEATMLFTSQRPGCTGGLQNMRGEQDTLYGDYFEDIFATINIGGEWRSPVDIGSNVNSTVHDATIGLSPDGQKLFVYRSDSVRWGNIFISEVEGNTWGKLKKMPPPINTDYWEGSASITSDEQILYFASNRPGGHGGRDLYRSRKLPNGDWGKPENLGPTINTEHHDDAPFIHADGKTLYFSSQGHNSMGSLHIFSTKLEDGEWQEPVNVGYPINSPDEDRYFVLSADGERAYYASSKQGGQGSVDLYVVHLDPKTEAVTLVKGKVTGCGGEVPEAKIKLIDKTTDNVEGISQPNKATGKYLLVLDKGATYSIEVTAENHKKYTKTIQAKADEAYKEVDQDIELECETAASAQDTAMAKKEVEKEKEQPDPEPEPVSSVPQNFKNIYFDFDKSSRTEESKQTLDKLMDFLNENDQVNITIVGHTDAKGSKGYNTRLSERRAESAKKYLVNNGIDEGRLFLESKVE
jgi:outer membrane protein OmpA-like peptidoglycan-associated protein